MSLLAPEPPSEAGTNSFPLYVFWNSFGNVIFAHVDEERKRNILAEARVFGTCAFFLEVPSHSAARALFLRANGQPHSL